LTRRVKTGAFKTALFISVFIFVAAFYSYVEHNLLSYDEQHYSGKDIVFPEDEEALGPPSWLIVVDLDHFALSVYKNGALIRTYPCSGGKDETPSPTGEFKIVKKEDWGEGFGGAWMGLDVPWGEFGIHGTKFAWVIGRIHASHGCIRMYTKDAKELSLMVPLGTPVRIIQNNRPFFTRYTGDSGSEVWNAQIALQGLGYYEGEIDGKFGKKLRNAILMFQEDHGLTVTGSLNQNTYEKLLEVLKMTRSTGV
jgi:hypothetical protein